MFKKIHEGIIWEPLKVGYGTGCHTAWRLFIEGMSYVFGLRYKDCAPCKEWAGNNRWNNNRSHLSKNKNPICLKVGDIGYVSGSAATITAIDTITSASYDVITFDGPVAGTAGAIIIEAGAVSTVAPVKGIYTLTIDTVPAVNDVLTVNGTAYTFATAAADGKIAIGADKVATAANLQDVLEADNQDFVAKANGAKVVFTQKVAGVGAIPTVSVTQTGGTLVAFYRNNSCG